MLKAWRNWRNLGEAPYLEASFKSVKKADKIKTLQNR